MTTQHTPTPWCSRKYTSGNSKRLTEIRSYGRPHPRICAMSEWDYKQNGKSLRDGDEQREANAEFIIRACNAHDALVSLVAEYRLLAHTDPYYADLRDRADKLIAEEAS